MRDPADLERRVEALEKQLATLGGGRALGRGIRYRSAVGIGDIPFVAVALGPDPSRGEVRGHARGVIAIGDIATGFVALGGLARGFFALGGLAIGGVTFGGLSLGALLAIGGFAAGLHAIGGAAIGGAAIGGAAVGYYACGGAAVGAHPVSALGVDPEGLRFFADHGVGGLCHPPASRR